MCKISSCKEKCKIGYALILIHFKESWGSFWAGRRPAKKLVHEIKDHLEKIHTGWYDFIIHGKVNLKDPEIIDDVKYSKYELCSST